MISYVILILAHHRQSLSLQRQWASQGNPIEGFILRKDKLSVKGFHLELAEHGPGAGGGVHPEELVSPDLRPVLAPERLRDL